MLLHLGLQQELHWLPTEQPIIFKILLMTSKCLNGIAPSYLSDLVTRYIPRRNLRFANGHRLFDVKYNLRYNGFRSFSVVSPQLWNDMPLGIRSCASLNDFKKKVKTYLGAERSVKSMDGIKRFITNVSQSSCIYIDFPH